MTTTDTKKGAATIEVERKFVLTPEIKKRIHALNPGVRTVPKRRRDTYYDTDACFLTTKGWWLRLRNERWELKCLVPGTQHSIAHDEVEDEEQIAQRLSLSGELSVSTLALQGIVPFANLYIERETIWRNDFVIVFDKCTADAGSFHYEVGEIERKVSREDVHIAEREIEDLTTQLGIDPTPVRGKVLEYLAKRRTAHYNLLVSAGIIDPTSRSAQG